MNRKITVINLRSHLSLLLLLAGIFTSMSLFAQKNLTIQGNVKDPTGEPVIGATIVQKGTTNGTASDMNGNFSLSVPANSTIQISYVGYLSQEINVGTQSVWNITLKDNQEVLNEVVVIGYGTVKKNDATGSLTAIKIDEKNKGLATTAQDLLSGKIAGVNVTSSGGRPGDGATIRIRGGSSLSASNDPLVIIDGVIISNDLAGSSNFLSTINPSDIETFTVLKDASATAIYGSRASNGVILITTKKGTIDRSGKSKLKVTYNGNASVSSRRNSVDVLTGDEYRAYITDRFKGDSREAVVLGKLGTANTEWQDEIFKSAFGTDHNVSIYGALGSKTPFRTSVGYTKQNGILKTSTMDRATASISLTPSLLNDYLKLNINGKGMWSRTRFAETGAVGAAVAFDPTQNVTDPNSIWGGYFTWTDNSGKYASIATKNPVATLMMQDNHAYVRNFIGNVQADYKAHFLPDLHFNLNLGLDIATTNGTDYKSPFNPNGYSENNSQSGSIKEFNNFKNNQLLEFYAQYLKEVPSIKSKFDVMGGYSWQHYRKTSDDDSWYLSKEDSYTKLGQINTSDNYSFKEYYLLSYFGRFNYTLNDKYLLTFTLRKDGSSRFTENNRWGIFPAAALAWKLKEEALFKNITAMNDLKLRLGWGKTGQQDFGDDYLYPAKPAYISGSGKAYYPMGYNQDGSVRWVNLMKPNGYNPDLKWETTTTWNAGLDYGFLNNRVNGALDVYSRKTTDLLNAEAPTVAGTSPSEKLPQNIGSLTNRGVEFSINARPIATRDFEWTVGYNIAYNKSKITKLTNDQDPSYKGQAIGSTGGDGGEFAQRYMKGYAPFVYYVYQQVYDQSGKPIEGMYVDRNMDGKVDESDLYFYKKPAPDVTMGFSSRWTYRDFDFGFNGRISLNNYVYNATAANGANMSLTALYSNDLFLSNKPTSALYTDFRSKQALSDYYVQNASFLKIDNITLGYSVRNLFAKSVMARFYATVQNPIVITKYDGLDPEVFNGIDYNLYPRPTTFLFGVNVNF
ncbi:MAG: SusC/RagA family protein [Bacteroidales bacterium 45-6]|nr:MAG: SusC/RagA family protein [Bacteroidales bacterium 45-6]